MADTADDAAATAEPRHAAAEPRYAATAARYAAAAPRHAASSKACSSSTKVCSSSTKACSSSKVCSSSLFSHSNRACSKDRDSLFSPSNLACSKDRDRDRDRVEWERCSQQQWVGKLEAAHHPDTSSCQGTTPEKDQAVVRTLTGEYSAEGGEPWPDLLQEGGQLSSAQLCPSSNEDLPPTEVALRGVRMLCSLSSQKSEDVVSSWGGPGGLYSSSVCQLMSPLPYLRCDLPDLLQTPQPPYHVIRMTF